MSASHPRLALLLLAMGLGACSGEDDCWIRVRTSGGHVLIWDETSEVECVAFDPGFDGTLDLSWDIPFDEVNIELHWVEVGDTGEFDATVYLRHQDETWRSEEDTGCVADLTRHERIRNRVIGFDRYIVEGGLSCADSLPAWVGTEDGPVAIGTVEFANHYVFFPDHY